ERAAFVCAYRASPYLRRACLCANRASPCLRRACLRLRHLERDSPRRGRALVDGEDHVRVHEESYAEPASARKREPMHTPSFEGVVDAARQIAPAAVRTPLIEHPALNAAVGGRVLLKAETLQVAGAFKFRGAYNRISRLSDNEKTRGVVAYSSGNHAQGVAAAAQAVGTRALIVMPSDSPAVKVDGVRA